MFQLIPERAHLTAPLPGELSLATAVLTATTPLERLSVAKTGLVDSIYKLKGGMWPMDTYYW